VTESVAPGNVEAAGPEEASAYIHDLLTTLAEMARTASLTQTNALIESAALMVQLEAAAKAREPQNTPGP